MVGPITVAREARDLLVPAASVPARVVADLPVAGEVVGRAAPHRRLPQVLRRQRERRLDEHRESLHVRHVDAGLLSLREAIDVLALHLGVRSTVARGLLKLPGDPRRDHRGEVLEAHRVHLLLVHEPARQLAANLLAFAFRNVGAVRKAVGQLGDGREVGQAVGVVRVAVVFRRPLQLQPAYARRMALVHVPVLVPYLVAEDIQHDHEQRQLAHDAEVQGTYFHILGSLVVDERLEGAPQAHHGYAGSREGQRNPRCSHNSPAGLCWC
mmetsp:Transcript_105326/g.307897  ORF Transcript_105326/g.307897 Transcript_105326/m.307897 type:complete len:268 (+) Transcript_105326:964-1767(+)